MSNQYTESNSAVQSHLNMLQNVISRMANNSALCKTWCITLVAAVIALAADKGTPAFATLITFPSLIFMILDCYYLALEKMFRKSYELFVRKVHENNVSVDDLFIINPKGDFYINVCLALKSFSVWPFYLLSIALSIIVKLIM